MLPVELTLRPLFLYPSYSSCPTSANLTVIDAFLFLKPEYASLICLRPDSQYQGCKLFGMFDYITSTQQLVNHIRRINQRLNAKLKQMFLSKNQFSLALLKEIELNAAIEYLVLSKGMAVICHPLLLVVLPCVMEVP